MSVTLLLFPFHMASTCRSRPAPTWGPGVPPPGGPELEPRRQAGRGREHVHGPLDQRVQPLAQPVERPRRHACPGRRQVPGLRARRDLADVAERRRPAVRRSSLSGPLSPSPAATTCAASCSHRCSWRSRSSRSRPASTSAISSRRSPSARSCSSRDASGRGSTAGSRSVFFANIYWVYTEDWSFVTGTRHEPRSPAGSRCRRTRSWTATLLTDCGHLGPRAARDGAPVSPSCGSRPVTRSRPSRAVPAPAPRAPQEDRLPQPDPVFSATGRGRRAGWRSNPADAYLREPSRRLDRRDALIALGLIVFALLFRLWRLDVPRPVPLRRGLSRALRDGVPQHLGQRLDSRRVRVDPSDAGEVPHRRRHRRRRPEQGRRQRAPGRAGVRARRRAAARVDGARALDRLHGLPARRRSSRPTPRPATRSPAGRPADRSPRWRTTPRTPRLLVGRADSGHGRDLRARRPAGLARRARTAGGPRRSTPSSSRSIEIVVPPETPAEPILLRGTAGLAVVDRDTDAVRRAIEGAFGGVAYAQRRRARRPDLVAATDPLAGDRSCSSTPPRSSRSGRPDSGAALAVDVGALVTGPIDRRRRRRRPAARGADRSAGGDRRAPRHRRWHRGPRRRRHQQQLRRRPVPPPARAAAGRGHPHRPRAVAEPRLRRRHDRERGAETWTDRAAHRGARRRIHRDGGLRRHRAPSAPAGDGLRHRHHGPGRRRGPPARQHRRRPGLLSIDAGSNAFAWRISGDRVRLGPRRARLPAGRDDVRPPPDRRAGRRLRGHRRR